MADSPLGNEGIQSAAKFIGGILATMGGVKVVAPFVTAIWDRLRRRDEHLYALTDRRDNEAWMRLAAEERLTDELRKQLMESELERYKLTAQLEILKAENHRYRNILQRFNHLAEDESTEG